MDKEVVPWRCKGVDRLLILVWDYFRLHQRKNGKVTMEVAVPKIHILRHNKCTDMIQRVL